MECINQLITGRPHSFLKRGIPKTSIGFNTKSWSNESNDMTWGTPMDWKPPNRSQEYLVGGIPTPLTNMSSSVGMMTFPVYGKS